MSGEVSFSFRSGNIRECRGSLQWAGENSTFVQHFKERISFLIIMEVFNFFKVTCKVCPLLSFIFDYKHLINPR